MGLQITANLETTEGNIKELEGKIKDEDLALAVTLQNISFKENEINNLTRNMAALEGCLANLNGVEVTELNKDIISAKILNSKQDKYTNRAY